MQAQKIKISSVFDEDNDLLKPRLFSKEEPRSKVMGALTRKAVKKLNRDVVHGAGRGEKKSGYRKRSGHGNVFDYKKVYNQRVAVKSHYVKHVGKAANAKTMRAHAYYLQREEVGIDGGKPDFYNAEKDSVNAGEFVNSAKHDELHWRVMISPENGTQIEDMNAYVRDVMAQYEERLGTELQWGAVNHYNTDNPHAHVVIRGVRDNGKVLNIDADFISHGMRQIASEVASDYLGLRTYQEVQQARVKEVTAERVTSLDFKISDARDADTGVVDVRWRKTLGRNNFEDMLVRGRLNTLVAMDLAEQKKPGLYVVKEDFKKTLSEVAKRKDVIKQMYDKMGAKTAQMAYVDLRKDEGKKVTGIVVDKGQIDELRDRYYVVVEDRQGRPNYINIGGNRSYPEIRKGAVLEVGTAQASTSKADKNIDMIAKQNGGVYNADRHQAYVDKEMDFIPVEDRETYVNRHLLRLESFVESGTVERVNAIEFKVPDDIRKQGEMLTEKMNDNLKKYGVADIKFVSRIPLDNQVGAFAWTDLDEFISARSKKAASNSSGWKAFEAYADKREEFLRANGYAKDVDGKLHITSAAKPKLQAQELKEAGGKIAKKFDRLLETSSNIQKLHGVYKGCVNLHSGQHAVISYGQKITLLPVKGHIKAAIGQEITAALGKNKSFSIRSRALGLNL